MSGGRDLSGQLQLGPPELLNGLDVPSFFLERQFRFQDDHILCPANGHSRGHNLRSTFIGAVEIPHPPQIPGRESSDVRV